METWYFMEKHLGKRLNLSGSDWLLKGYLGEDWQWRDAHKATTRDTSGWITATVPGSVQQDLFRAGLISDPYYDLNSLLVEWVPARTWVYVKTFTVPSEWKANRITLVFEGIDYSARFFLNGKMLGTHEGMFSPAVFDVSSELLFDGENRLAVVIDPAPPEQPQVGCTSRVRTTKSRMSYGWDFSPRLIDVGIWDQVYLEATGPVRMTDVWARPALDRETGKGLVRLSVSLDSPAALQGEVKALLSLGQEAVVSDGSGLEVRAGENQITFTFRVSEPRLWWPNGLGDQPVYSAAVRVLTSTGESDSRTVPFAFRDVKLVNNLTADSTARPYTFEVNGRKVYIKGWNWVPLDPLYGPERPEKLERLMRLAQRGNVNLLRVWGGGLIERESFYHWCDRLGLMVWQEFILSSSGIESRPSDDPAFLEAWAREAEQIIPRKRNHPALVLWCGGNELQGEDGSPLDERTPVLAALEDVVRRLDPDRAWLPTSPSGRAFGNNLASLDRDPTALHDVHGPWEYQGLTKHYSLYNRGSALLNSEFGAEGVTNSNVLATTVAPARLLPYSRSNPIWAHRGGWWVNEQVMREAFGEIGDVQTLVRASQFLQAEGLRYAVESNLRRIGQNSGSIPWQFNESFPNAASTSAIDYYAAPKPAYYTVGRAYEPIHASARYETLVWGGESRFRAELFVTNTSAQSVENARLHARLVLAGGSTAVEEKAALALNPYQSRQFLEIGSPLAELGQVFYLDLAVSAESGETLSRNRYVYTSDSNLVPLLSLSRTGLSVAAEIRDQRWTIQIRNTGSTAAFCLWLEDARQLGAPGYVYFSENWKILFPDETWTVEANWVGEAGAKIRIQGWNTESYFLSATD